MRTDANLKQLRGRGVKLTNPVAKALGTYFDAVPKTVLAAIVVSLLREDPELPIYAMDDVELRAACEKEDVGATVRAAVCAEWIGLHDSGLVPQVPIQPETAK